MKSWWLKLNRAEEHLQDLDLQLWHYSNSHPYIEQRTNCREHSDCRRYLLRITRPPSPHMAIIAGEAAHAMRSALDHIAVALAPPRFKDSAFFPIFRADIRENPEARERFDKAVNGMNPDAIAVIKDYQPYQVGPDKTAIRSHALNVISTIDNADKHQHFAVLASGLVNANTVIRVRGDQLRQSHEPGAFVHEGAEIAHFALPEVTPPIEDSEVHVRISGLPGVAVDVGIKDGYVELPGLRLALTYVRDHIIPDLEPFVR